MLYDCPHGMQFSQNEDFDKYPRDNEADVAQLATAGVDAVFEPSSLYIRSGGYRHPRRESTCRSVAKTVPAVTAFQPPVQGAR